MHKRPLQHTLPHHSRTTRLVRPATPGTPLLLGVILVVLVLVGFLGWKTWRSYELAQALREDVRALEQIAREDVDTAMLEALSAQATRTRQRASALHDEAWLLLPFAPLFGWVPDHGSDLAAAGPLLDVTVHTTIALDETLTGLMPVLHEIEHTGEVSTTLVAELAAAQPHLNTGYAASQQALAAWEEVPVDRLSSQLRGPVRRAESLLPLLDTGLVLSLAAADTARALEPVLPTEGDNARFSRVLVSLDAAQPQIEQARSSLARAEEMLRTAPRERWPAVVSEWVAEVEPLLPTARRGLELALVLPDLLGADGRRAYLVVNQNPDELRATGGAIGSAGPLVFEQGELVELTIEPADYSPADYPAPPWPYREYMGIDQWIYRDANWSPDFPTAAPTILELYEIQHERRFDNLLAFDPTAVELVLQGIGPVEVAGYPQPVTAQDAEAFMREQYNIGLDSTEIGKKDFIQPLLEAIINRLETEYTDINIFALIDAVTTALDQRHILLYSAEPELQSFLAAHHWDGSVRPDAHDFLMVVGSNFGYNKANPSIRQDVTYAVNLTDLAQPQAEVTVRHRHLLDLSGECNHWGGKWRPINQYEDSFVDCYWDYLRILVPAGSDRFTWDTQVIPSDWLAHGNRSDDPGMFLPLEQINGAQVLGTFFVVPFGEERSTVLRYQLPPAVLRQAGDEWLYSLKIQKQPGRDPVPFLVQLTLPEGAEVTIAEPVPDMQIAQTLIYGLGLPVDQTVTIRFRAPPLVADGD